MILPAISQEKNKDFIEIFHTKASSILYNTLTYIEKFAGTENIKAKSKAYLKINYGYYYDPYQTLKIEKSINVNVRLKKLEKKLNLFFSSIRRKESQQRELKPYYNNRNNKNDGFSLGLEYIPLNRYLNINLRVAVTTIKKIYLKTTINTPKIILGGFSIEIMELARRDMYIFGEKPLNQDYTQIYINKLLYKDLILSFFIERRKFSNEAYNKHIISSSLSKIYGEHKKFLVTFNFSESGNKVIGAYPVVYNTGIYNRYKFYKWAYFNFNFGVKWQRQYNFQNNPYVFAGIEIYFGKW